MSVSDWLSRKKSGLDVGKKISREEMQKLGFDLLLETNNIIYYYRNGVYVTVTNGEISQIHSGGY